MTPHPSGSQISDMRHTGSSHAQVTSTQPGSHSLRVTVLRARNPPRLKTLLWRKANFYVAVTCGATTRRTRPVQRRENIVEWNENLDTFIVQSQSDLTVSLYVERPKAKDILIGNQKIACEPTRELDIIFGNADGHWHSKQTKAPATVLMVTVSSNASSSRTATVSTPNLIPDNPVTEGGAPPHIVQSDAETAQPTTVAAPRSEMGDHLVGSGSGTRVGTVPDSQPGMSSHPDRAEEAMDTVTIWKSAVDVMKQVVDTVSPIVKERARSTSAQLSNIPDDFVHKLQHDGDFRSLLEAILNAFEFTNEDGLRNIQTGSMQAKILIEMLKCVSECAGSIRSCAFAAGSSAKTDAVANLASNNVERLRKAVVQLRDLRGQFTTHVALPTVAPVPEETDMSNQASDTELNAIIGESPLLGGWRFTDRQGCYRDTRKHFLDHIVEWVKNPESDRGLLLLGQAGTGKSSIAHEIALRFDETSRYLGSYVAFVRKEKAKESNDEAYHFFTTLARGLSDRYPQFKLALKRAIASDPSFGTTRDPRRLFTRLLLNPLKSVPLDDPILIIIDGLDESGITIGGNPLHTFLAQRLIDLPSNVRILITSRSEDDIEQAFFKAESVHTLYMDDDDLAANTKQDISLYIQSKLREDVFKDYGSKLLQASQGLFQWAAIACGFINSHASLGLSYNECVQRLLAPSRGRSGEGPLDNLYEEVLQGYFDLDKAQVLFRSIMGQLFAAIEPLSINSLIALRQHAPVVHPEDSNQVLRILRCLGSLLSNVTSLDQTGPILPLHTSFRDFLTSKTSNVFYVDLVDAHHDLSHSCLGLMLDGLKFNMCKLESSYLANSDVQDLESRIAKYIPSALQYGCIYWSDHLCRRLAFDHEVLKKLRSFFETKFLFWLEVLSVKNSVGLASRALSSLSVWLLRERSQTEVKNLLGLAKDASSFVRYFGKAVARSAPHIYVSALPFAPASSQILHQYLPEFPRTLRLERGQLSHWPELEMTIEAHDDIVNCVAFSPDGECIASGSSDRTIRVWDAITGQIIASPFTGHTDDVRSVAFSPDGERITSGSLDGTIRVWDATTGQIIAGPFTGHTDYVTSVAFSPDGERITSGSFDHTIRVWDATTGQTIAGPFTGHTDYVTSVAFSPDGERIVSGSDDDTIRVWDATTGQIIAGPFTGHTDYVTSVAFSPDGERFTSGSLVGTIVWDATTGQIIAGPFTGHTDCVTSVAFSPDGERIVSGSDDLTIRVWDATTGQIIAGPFTGHIDCVRSVAFSPDGERITSGSLDSTIRVWDATTGHIASASDNGTIHVETVTMTGNIKDQFTDPLIDDDGWLHGEEDELVLWIPELHRPCLHRPSIVCIAGKHETRLDLSDFAYGSNWATSTLPQLI